MEKKAAFVYLTVKTGRESKNVEQHEDLNLKPDLLLEDRLNTNGSCGEATFINATDIPRGTLMSDQSSSCQIKSDKIKANT